MTAILTSVVDEGRRLVDLAATEGTPLALLGGVAVRLRATEVPASLERQYKDLDFAVPKGAGHAAGRLLERAGYEPHLAFNALNSGERMLFHDNHHRRQVDLFIGSFRMCHEVPFSDRLKPGEPTLPLAELLLTKLQIVELNEKDVRDTVLLLHGHEVADHDEGAISAPRVAKLCGGDWGLWRTITANLGECQRRLDDYALSTGERSLVAHRLRAILQRIEEAPKSRGWKLRAKLGERRRWYELPEEVAE